MLILLSQCEFNVGKTLQVYEMNQREMKNYKKLYEEIGLSRFAILFQNVFSCRPSASTTT